MINSQQEEASVSLTQSELKTIINVFNACPIKLGDAVVMLPIVSKIMPLIKQEPKEPASPTVESVSKD